MNVLSPPPTPRGRVAPVDGGGTVPRGPVRDALAHLNDPVFLQTHPLTRLLPGEAGQRGHPQAGKALRQHLKYAIALLYPPGTAPEGTRAWRRHRLLHLRYEGGLPPRR